MEFVLRVHQISDRQRRDSVTRNHLKIDAIEKDPLLAEVIDMRGGSSIPRARCVEHARSIDRKSLDVATPNCFR